MALRTEYLADGWLWWRIAERVWTDPLDPTWAKALGGRWNPPDSFPTLYLNEDRVTARANLRAFIEGWPYEPEDLRDENGPVLVAATLPRRQRVGDIHTRAGVRAVGLPASYPEGSDDTPVPRSRCQPLGQRARDAGLRGLRVRSAQTRDGGGRELAWFPATARSRAREVERLDFEAWYWG